MFCGSIPAMNMRVPPERTSLTMNDAAKPRANPRMISITQVKGAPMIESPNAHTKAAVFKFCARESLKTTPGSSPGLRSPLMNTSR